MYMIKMYIIKIQSRNLTHDHRLLAVQKVSFQMILKNKVKNDRDRLQKYWANSASFDRSNKIYKKFS